MKFKPNRHYLQISLYAAGALALGGIIILSAANIDKLGMALGKLAGVFKPVVWAIVIAYILDPAVRFFEFRLFKSWQSRAETYAQKRGIHSFSLALTVFIAVIFLLGFLWLVAPQLVASLSKMAEQFDNLPIFFNEAEAWINLSFGADSALSGIIENPLNELESIALNAWELLRPELLPFLTKMSGGVVNAFGTAFNLLLAAVIAVNMLSVKDMLLKQARKIMYCFIPKDACGRILLILGKSNKIFKRYIIGLSLDSIIVGVICFAGSALMGIRYSLLIGIIFGICNFIPLFGPFIGAVPASLIILMDEPVKVIWFLIFLIIVQQIDGNILAPIIHGDAMGVPSVWVLISISVGGGLFGFTGMLLAVPIFAIIYMLAKAFTEDRLLRRGLPVSSNLYSDALMSDGTAMTPNVSVNEEYLSQKRIPLLKRLYRFIKGWLKSKKRKNK